MTSKIRYFIIEKSFSSCIEFILNSYRKLSAKERVSADATIEILTFWKEYESQSYKMSLEDIKRQWNEFDLFVFNKGLSKNYETISMIAQSIMLDVQEKTVGQLILPHDKRSFGDKILYSKSLLWTGNIKEAFSYISALTRYYPTESEPWALLGKIYFLINQREKSILFYREAFFINPTILNLIDIRSSFIDELFFLSYELLGLEKEQTNKEFFLQWVGIYGVSHQFFNQRRELTEKEKTVLAKRLIVYEKQYAKNANEEFLNLLRISVFCYDYYFQNNNLTLANELLDKIEILSPAVYRKLLP